VRERERDGGDETPFEDAKSLAHKKPFDSFPICKMICVICPRRTAAAMGF
jgi:hypothetical protein